MYSCTGVYPSSPVSAGVSVPLGPISAGSESRAAAEFRADGWVWEVE